MSMSVSKKRQRDAPNVDVSLVEVYEDLAHEDEEIRVRAAHSLLSKHFQVADQEQRATILKRLFRGLCSGRKAARLGFSIALTEVLTQLRSEDEGIQPSQVLDILESSTISESGTTGQDERDHYFGRLFGSEAIIKSGLIFSTDHTVQWERLLDLLCNLANKKPWLRQECGWILYNCVRDFVNKPNGSDVVTTILAKLIQHKLIRTPEGLAIWLSAQHALGESKLPKNVWKYGDPLAKKDLHHLGQILKDAKADSANDAEYGVQGSATWSAQLHFAWDVVLSELLEAQKTGSRISFDEFWQVAVDDGLFAAQNSRERQHWGLLLLQKVIKTAPKEKLSRCFTKNATNCFLQSLKANDRYLQKGAQKVSSAIQTRCQSQPASADILLSALLTASNIIDFDTVTKTKTVESAFMSCNAQARVAVARMLGELVMALQEDNQTESLSKRRNVVNMQSRLLTQIINASIKHATAIDFDSINAILESWVTALKSQQDEVANDTKPNESAISLLLQRIAAALEQILKLGKSGHMIVLRCVSMLTDMRLSAEDEIREIVNSGWKRFNVHYKRVVKASEQPQGRQDIGQKKSPKIRDGDRSAVDAQTNGDIGLALVFALLIFQVYSNEPEAVSILEELLAFEEQSARQQKDSRTSVTNADGLIEILLSFASKPSKFLRRIVLVIFEAFTSQITREGLSSLTDILQAKESKEGQQELFETEVDGGADDASHDSDSDSDVDMLDSDVEIIDAQANSDSESGTDLISQSGSDSDDDEASSSDEVDDDLAALESSLAKALGTRKFTTEDMAYDLEGSQSNSGSDSDSDMDDDQMLSLDAKLSEVFRTRAAAQTQSKTKQKENKSAKENMTNFKNRVLDMVDVYIKKESSNPDVLDLVLPLLVLARTTQVKQLAGRAVELVKSLCNRCKGMQNVPQLKKASAEGYTNGAIPESSSEDDDENDIDEAEDEHNDDDIEWALSIFESIHDEACLASSNVHKSACSQSSILLAKTLINANVDVSEVVDLYSTTQIRMMTDPTVTVQEAFFRDWIGWCGTVRGKIGPVTVADKNSSTVSNAIESKIPSDKSSKPTKTKKTSKGAGITDAEKDVNNVNKKRRLNGQELEVRSKADQITDMNENSEKQHAKENGGGKKKGKGKKNDKN